MTTPTRIEHDSLGRLVRTVHPEVEVDDGLFWQPEETVAYDDTANTVTSTDGNGHATVSTFDLEGRLVRVANAVGGTREIGYDAAGNKVLESSWFDPATPRLDNHFSYDAAGRLVRRDEPEGRVTEYGYDAVGNLVSETLSDGSPGSTFTPRVTSHAYDQLGRRIRTVRDPAGLGAATEWLLDGEGNPLRVTDAEGRQSFRDHDELGRVVESRGPEWRPGRPAVARTFYDGNGNPVRELRLNQRLEADGSWSDADQERLSAYDELDRLIVATDAEGGQRRLRYDPSGNLVEEVDPRGNRTSHGYDALDRQVSTTLHLSDPVTGTPWDVVTTRIFDAVGNLRHEDLPNGNRVSCAAGHENPARIFVPFN